MDPVDLAISDLFGPEEVGWKDSLDDWFGEQAELGLCENVSYLLPPLSVYSADIRKMK